MQVNAKEDCQREIIIEAVEKIIKTEEEEMEKREETFLSEAQAEAKVHLATEVNLELVAAKCVNESRQNMSSGKN